ncbi:hypothetical protein DAPPUDRAFT_234113 [Daphnia pulex]|uniref:Uncharacterized protein n=1 Tax=Daphnia pulex TaxID=6669 RepID=E9FUL6_DAPPU|nr:hypothetical protein DAPPUDRAFT_234113 [Daphnia pulex]|eukprot:EFX88904.1 hypothetical protein DAPPUDRAFT_234113 [Daphnia pulex]
MAADSLTDSLGDLSQFNLFTLTLLVIKMITKPKIYTWQFHLLIMWPETDHGEVGASSLQSNVLCCAISCSQLVKGVPLAGLLPVPFVAFVTFRNNSEQFKCTFQISMS